MLREAMAGRPRSNGNKSPGLHIPKETLKLQLLLESNFTSRRTRYVLKPQNLLLWVKCVTLNEKSRKHSGERTYTKGFPYLP